jgi:hypothetical protein
MWAVAEIIFAYYERTLGDDAPYPSIADAIWLIAYVVMAVGLYLRYRSLRLTPTGTQLFFAGSAFLIFAILSIFYVISPTASSASSEGLSPVEQFIGLAYPIGDLIIVLGAVMILMIMFGGQLSLPWQLIGLGFLAISFSDTFYTYGTITGEYGAFNALTVFCYTSYVAGYVVIGLGLYQQGRIQGVL